jgi:hypothetical protein
MSELDDSCVMEFAVVSRILVGAFLLAIDHARPGSVALRCSSVSGEYFYDLHFVKGALHESDFCCQPFFGKIKSLSISILATSTPPRPLMQIHFDSGQLAISHQCFILTTRKVGRV